MQQITVDSQMGARLTQFKEQSLVCDAEGRVLGFFSPLDEPVQLDELNLDPPLSIEQTEELRKKNRTGKPLDEILARLGY